MHLIRNEEIVSSSLTVGSFYYVEERLPDEFSFNFIPTTPQHRIFICATIVLPRRRVF